MDRFNGATQKKYIWTTAEQPPRIVLSSWANWVLFALFSGLSNVHCSALWLRERKYERWFSVRSENWNYKFINIDYEHYCQASSVLAVVADAVATRPLSICRLNVPINWNSNLFPNIYCSCYWLSRTNLRSNWYAQRQRWRSRSMCVLCVNDDTSIKHFLYFCINWLINFIHAAFVEPTAENGMAVKSWKLFANLKYIWVCNQLDNFDLKRLI